jgi:poly(A) polymerase
MFDAASEIISTIKNIGYDAYFVGGCVRDMLMNIHPKDIDIATNASIETIQSIFKETVPIGSAFGVILVIHKDIPFEVATFRSESNYLDGRRPSNVVVGTLEEDANRRDFTINGMFYNPISKEVIDIVDGKNDIAKKVIRCIGNPYTRFNEDRLRMIRCVRLSVNLGFTIENNTLQALVENSHLLFPSVSIERVWQELCKFISLSVGLVELHRYNLLQQIFPDLATLSTEDIISLVAPVDSYPNKTATILRIMALFPDLEESSSICSLLKVTRRDTNLCKKLCNTRRLLCRDDVSLIEWTYLYADPDAELLLLIMSKHTSDVMFLDNHNQRRIFLAPHIQRIIENKPLVTSKILISKGIKSGPNLGYLLKESERITINNNLHDVDSVLKLLQL